MQMSDATEKVCKACLESNLIQEIKIARCSKCFKVFCIHFVSKIDPEFCVECLSDVSMIKEEVVKIYQKYDEETDTVISKRGRKATDIKMGGLDWLFKQRQIFSLSDDELELAISYHRGILGGMLCEREERRIAKAHRYANSPLNTPKNPSSTEEVKKTKTIKSTKEAATAAGVVAAMQAQGISPIQLLQMLQKKMEELQKAGKK